MDVTRESRQIVRIYSFEVEDRASTEGARVLGQALVEGEDGTLQDVTAPWRRFFEDPEDRNESRYVSKPISKMLGALTRHMMQRCDHGGHRQRV